MNKPKEPWHPKASYVEGPNRAGMQHIVTESDGVSVRLRIASEQLAAMIANGHYAEGAQLREASVMVEQVRLALQYADELIRQEALK